MISFTKQEKCVLLFIAVVILSGGVSRILFNQYPRFRRSLQIIDQKKSYFSVDLNAATQEELVKIPYIGEYTAQSIIHYRKKHGPFKDLIELKNVKGIRDKNYEQFVFYLEIP